MERMCSPLFVFAVFSLAASQNPSITSEVEAEPGHDWSDGFDGNFRITPDVPIQAGWRINVKFSQPISKLEVWKAKIESENDEKTEFGLVNRHDNADLSAGDTYSVYYKGTKSGRNRPAPKIMVTLERLGAGQVPSITSEVEAEPGHDWSDGFDGNFRITPDVPIQAGWRINVKFSQPISKLEVWQAKIESENDEKTEFGLVNRHDNADLPAGDTYSVYYKGTKFGRNRPAPKITVTLERLGGGSGLYEA